MRSTSSFDTWLMNAGGVCRICLRHLAWNPFTRRAAAKSHVVLRLYTKVFTTHAVYISNLRLQGKPACPKTFCKDLKSDFAMPIRLASRFAFCICFLLRGFVAERRRTYCSEAPEPNMPNKSKEKALHSVFGCLFARSVMTEAVEQPIVNVL